MTTPASVAIFIRALDGGGAQRDAILLANGLAQKGLRVVLLTLHPEGPLRALVAPAVPILAIGAKKLRGAPLLLARALRQHAPQVLISSEPAPNLVAYAATRLLPRRNRPRLVLREVASPVQAQAADAYWQTRIAYRAMHHVYGKADRVVTLTDGSKADLVAHFAVDPARIAVLHTNAVIDPEHWQRPDMSDLDDGREPGLVVAMGRLSPEKGHDTLIAAVARIRHRPLRVVIVGEGPQRGELQRLIDHAGLGDIVGLPGYTDDPLAWFRRARLAVSSSRWEGLGNALVEALACGTPVVATDCPHGPREVLDQGRFGTLVPMSDPAALAAAIDTALADTAVDRQRLQQRARRYTTDRAADAFLTVIHDLLSDQSTAPAASTVLSAPDVTRPKRTTICSDAP